MKRETIILSMIHDFMLLLTWIIIKHFLKIFLHWKALRLKL